MKEPELVMLQTEPEPLEIDLQRTAILVIDMQNAFVKKGAFLDLSGIDPSPSQQVVQPIKDICEAARTKQIKIIYTASTYSPDLRELGNPSLACWHKDLCARMYREHPEWRDKLLIRGTWGVDIIEELEPQKADIFMEKHRYTSFFETNLDVTLEGLNIKYLLFAGVATNGCVEATLRDAYYRGYFPILVSDAAAPVGPPYQQDATIFNVKRCYGWVITSQNLLQALQ